MKKPDPLEDLISKHRIGEPSSFLRERVLGEASKAWEERSTEGSKLEPVLLNKGNASWWNFAAAAALVLFAGLNFIQSGTNLLASRGLSSPPAMEVRDRELGAIAEAIGLEPKELQRMTPFGMPWDGAAAHSNFNQTKGK